MDVQPRPNNMEYLKQTHIGIWTFHLIVFKWRQTQTGQKRNEQKEMFMDDILACNTQKNIFRQNFKNYDQKNFLEYLFKMSWSVIDVLEDPSDQLHYFLTFFNEAAKLHASIMERWVYANDVPWKSSEFIQMME